MEGFDFMKLAVLFGGRSTEHEVSCVSAFSIIRNLDTKKYEIEMIGITKDGHWLPYHGDTEKLKDGTWEEAACRENHFTRDPKSTCCRLDAGLRVLQTCDVVLPVLHGLNGEDGTVQGLLELLNLPYVGCNVFASAAGMDKVYAKVHFADAGIPQCKHLVAYRKTILQDAGAYDAQVEAKLGYPCFVKPSNSGSSVGVRKAKNARDLHEALVEAARYDRKILIEEFVDGREIECAVLGLDDAQAAVPGEIVPSKEFYDYEDKYQSGSSYSVIPAEIPQEALAKIQEYALKAFAAIDGTGLSRVDFFYKKDGTILLNEINTLPGFTDISMYAKLWKASGLSYSDLLDRLIDLAFRRKEEHERCCHE